ncbi:MAG: hypothetical protein LBQ43_02185 [Holosporales bacterium]|jgi:hypothetical protein|nr:hypothetical protein [Holosporales bacterium]
MLFKKFKICVFGLISGILGAGQGFSANVVDKVCTLIQTDFVNPTLSNDSVLDKFLTLVGDDGAFREIANKPKKLTRLCLHLMREPAMHCHGNRPITSFNLCTRAILIQNLPWAQQNEKIRYLSGVLTDALRKELKGWNDSFSPFIISEFQFIVTSMGANYQPGAFNQILPMFQREHSTMSDTTSKNSCSAHGCINQGVYLETLKILDEDQALTSSEKLDIANWLIMTDYGTTRRTMFVDQNGGIIVRGGNETIPYATAQQKLVDMIGNSPAKVAFLSTIAEYVGQRLGFWNR